MNKNYIADLFMGISEADSLDELWQLFVRFLETFKLIHGRVSIFDLGVEISPEELLHLRTYPEGPDSWGEHYVRNDMHVHDRSFHLIFEHCTEALEWQEMDRLTRQGTEANRVFEEMRAFGIGNGLLIAKSSNIKNKTILMGIAGPGRVFRDFKKRHYRALLHCLHTFNSCYLELAIRDGKLDRPLGDELKLTERAREIVKLMSHDYDSADIAAKLGISENGLNQALKRLRKSTGMKTRAGIVARALRAKHIQ